MSVTTVKATYKKQDGVLQYDETGNEVTWRPAPGSSGVSTLAIKVSGITNLQQTPASSPRVALKISASTATSSEPENHVFNFTARPDQEAITAVLRNAITASRASAVAAVVSTPEPHIPNDSAQPAAMAISSALRYETRPTDSWDDDKRLISNTKLQQSLIAKDPALKQRFEQSLRDKPDTTSLAQFGTQFWSSRIHLLRAHAIEESQKLGGYNVLAEVKDTTVDGTRKLSLTKQHIHALFDQHPIIKHAYNDNVPDKLSESEFWMRFFNSKLLRKLKGEPINDSIATDHILDRYLHTDPATYNGGRQTTVDMHVPNFIDLEGNEQHHSQRKGNQPDWTMRPEASGKVPILHILNNMSEKIMSNAAPADGDPHAPVGMTEDAYQQLRLRDLQAETNEERVILNIKDQKHLFGGANDTDISAEARLYADMDPSSVLKTVRRQLKKDLTLDTSGDAEDDSRVATTQIMSLIGQQRELLAGENENSNLSSDIYQSLLLTHNTTSEFLHYFWATFLSNANKPSYKSELSSLCGTLIKSSQRITAVADNAEKERQAKFAELKRNALEYQSKTGKKRKIDESMVAVGGKKDVEALMRPTLTAVKFAQEQYAAL